MKKQVLNIDKPLWVIRAGLSSAAHDLFIKKRLIVLMEQEMGDLRALPKERQAFYSAFQLKHAGEAIQATSGIGGKFFRFIHEVKIGDYILYPCRIDMKIYFGVVTGPYCYTASRREFPHSRRVVWKTSFPKKALSLFARRELNTARTFFVLKNNADEIRGQISTVIKVRK